MKSIEELLRYDISSKSGRSHAHYRLFIAIYIPYCNCPNRRHCKTWREKQNELSNFPSECKQSLPLLSFMTSRTNIFSCQTHSIILNGTKMSSSLFLWFLRYNRKKITLLIFGCRKYIFSNSKGTPPILIKLFWGSDFYGAFIIAQIELRTKRKRVSQMRILSNTVSSLFHNNFVLGLKRSPTVSCSRKFNSSQDVLVEHDIFKERVYAFFKQEWLVLIAHERNIVTSSFSVPKGGRLPLRFLVRLFNVEFSKT